MFALFFSLYYAMFTGQYINLSIGNIRDLLKPSVNVVGEFLTSIFGEFQVTNIGDVLFGTTTLQGTPFTNWLTLLSFVLALITSIGIVVMAVKGIKRVFSIFFMPIR